jgi:hypothetical protein
MAKAKRKKKRFAIRFELGFPGLLATGIVCFCIFLWMFLLGIWAGQTVLQSDSSASLRSLASLGAGLKGNRGGFGQQERILTATAKQPVAAAEETIDSEAEPEYAGLTFFTLQVGSFDSESRAIQEVGAWFARDEQAFYCRPSGKEDRYRVFAGRYDTLERASERAPFFENQHDTKVYITLLQESEVVVP